MEILHKRTTNNENTLIENLSEGELGLVLSENTEDTKIVLKNNSGGIEEIYTKSHPINCGEWNVAIEYNVGDILYYNSATQKYTVSSSVTTDYGKPIGIVVVPTSHNLYGDNSCGIMSLNIMRYDNPENGGSDQNMYWGGRGVDTSLKNYDKVYFTESSSDEYGYIASNKSNCTKNSNDGYGYSEANNNIPLIYKADGSKNAQVYADDNAMMDVDGKANTDVLISLATAQTDWKTATTITNSYKNGYYPAACCCWRYNPNGVTQGKWYLPSTCELAYVMSKYNEIDNKLTELNNLEGITTYSLVNSGGWASTEFSYSASWYLYFGDGRLAYYAKAFTTSVRSFLRFAGGLPL